MATLGLEMLLSFFATLSYGVLFNTPPRLLVYSGLLGMSVWVARQWMADLGVPLILFTFLAAFLSALASHWLAILFKVPVTVFSIAGIIPLVPGSKAFYAMQGLVGGDLQNGFQYALDTFLSGSAIAGGLVLAVAIFQLYRGMGRYVEKMGR